MTTQLPAEGESDPSVSNDLVRSARKGQKGFTRGVSGNPRGRPRGSSNKIQSLSQELIDDHPPAIVAKALELALADDGIRALKFLLDRLVPPKRSQPITLHLPKTQMAKEILTALDTVEKNLLHGEISAAKLRMVIGTCWTSGTIALPDTSTVNGLTVPTIKTEDTVCFEDDMPAFYVR